MDALWPTHLFKQTNMGPLSVETKPTCNSLEPQVQLVWIGRLIKLNCGGIYSEGECFAKIVNTPPCFTLDLF